MTAADIVEAYLSEHPGLLSWERVEVGFWYVRVGGTARRVIPIEIALDQRTLRVLSYFMIPPDTDAAEAYWYLLRQNWAASGVAFAGAPDGAVCLVSRIPIDRLDADELDAVIGKVVDATERSFRGYLRIGFPALSGGERRAGD